MILRSYSTIFNPYIPKQFMKEEQFKYSDKAIIRGEIFMLPKSSAIDFINECKVNNYRILGVDGFYITENSTRPSLEHSIDFTSGDHKIIEDIYSDAIKFIASHKDELHYEIVYKNIKQV